MSLGTSLQSLIAALPRYGIGAAHCPGKSPENRTALRPGADERAGGRYGGRYLRTLANRIASVMAGETGSHRPASDQAPRLLRWRLVGLSFLMLFVELALIRWLGANIIYLSYYSNFVLLGSFLGIGIGFLRAKSKVNLFPWAPVALSLLVLFVLVFPVQISHTSGTQLIFF